NAQKPTLISDRVLAAEAKLGRTLPNGNMATAHAEIGAIQKAFEAGATQGARMTLTVSGKPICGYCYGDIAAMAERAGMRSLSIFEKATGNTYRWEQGMRSIREAP
ncbi:MAG: adhesin, partial [Acaryochloridaceae cyanobacterium RU_4_10]|nr:adhesin [Acaryochloridaceae cyanobacterium RU_4_10]